MSQHHSSLSDEVTLVWNQPDQRAHAELPMVVQYKI